MTPEFNDAYRDGWNAYRAVVPIGYNPFNKRTQKTEYLAWRQGWQESEMKAEEEWATTAGERS